MTLQTIFDDSFSQHLDVTVVTKAAMRKPFCQLVSECERVILSGGKIVFFGNGGSAADSQHLAAELTVRYVRNRPPIPSIALTTDTSVLTAAGNDLGFNYIFSRQIAAICTSKDIVIGLSTSGLSDNILIAFKTAREIGCSIAALGGWNGGKMKELADIILMVPSNETARIQEMHILIGHALCETLEKQLGFT